MHRKGRREDCSQQPHLNHSSSLLYTDTTFCTLELKDILRELGLSRYLHAFLEEGFDTWFTILDIKESDFDALGVKLGHRRKLQRKIAHSRGLSSDSASEPLWITPNEACRPEKQEVDDMKVDVKDSGVRAQGVKRKYRRHPKRDENAPERPSSAYMIFANEIRKKYKVKSLSFTEIAKLVGESWQNLLISEKKPYELQALAAKTRYSNELAEHKKTDSYREYMRYLAEFKTRQTIHQPGTFLRLLTRTPIAC